MRHPFAASLHQPRGLTAVSLQYPGAGRPGFRLLTLFNRSFGLDHATTRLASEIPNPVRCKSLSFGLLQPLS
jgi:hypothetical protein